MMIKNSIPSLRFRFRFTLTLALTVALSFGIQGSEIHNAVASGDLKAVSTLIEANRNLIHAKDSLGQTPLHVACASSHWDIANYLIDAGADVDARNRYGISVLSHAIKPDRDGLDTVRLLVRKGAEINVKNSAVGSPIHCAVNRSNFEALDFLIKNGGNINVPGRYGTPLQTLINFIQNPDMAMAKYLVESGAKPTEYSYGLNSLHLAAIKGMSGLVQSMLGHGWDINAKDDYGHTPLFYAIRHHRSETAEILKSSGAHPVSRNNLESKSTDPSIKALGCREAFLWYLGPIHSPGTGYAIKTKNHLLLFDPRKIGETSDKALANGYLNSSELNDQNITFFFTHTSYDAVLLNSFPDATVVYWDESGSARIEDHSPQKLYPAGSDKQFSVGELNVHSIPSSGRHNITKIYGLGYLVEVDGLKIFHSGLHSSTKREAQIEAYKSGIDSLKLHAPIDIAILPIRGRHLPLAYQNYLYLIEELSPGAIYLIGDDMVRQEHRKCLNTLKGTHVPIFYPNGGVAVGQRFKYPPTDQSIESDSQ